MDEALGRVSGAGLAELMFPRFDPTAASMPLVDHWHGRQPRRRCGQGRVRPAAMAVTMAAKRTRAVILVRTETNPDDLPGMVAAKGAYWLTPARRQD